MSQWLQRSDLKPTDFANNNSSGAGGVTVKTDAASSVGIAIATAVGNAIAAIPADKFLQGLGGYNAATNVLTLTMSDGSSVNVDMSGLVADAVATAFAGKVPFQDNSGATVGYLLAL
jgi:hypothetical protein